MASTIKFHPVGNGDMTLITLDSGRTILIDVNICDATDDSDRHNYDAAADLRKDLSRDAYNRPYVDVFMLSHPDEDHCRGLQKHFHLGRPEDYAGDKVFISEIWSSPRVFRRASSINPLCEDARAFNCEAKRRVKAYLQGHALLGNGNRVLVLGHDEDGRTDELVGSDILVEVEQRITRVNGAQEPGFGARLLGPLPEGAPDENGTTSKNDSSVILNVSLQAGGPECQFLTGGDASVGIWERIWHQYADKPDWLQYDLLLAPHHCSWHALSHDSWRDHGENAQVSVAARNALGQALSGACIVSSSKPISDEDADPPCIRATREYKAMLKPVSGQFMCTGEQPPIKFEIRPAGLTLQPAKARAPAIIASQAGQGEPLPHG